ncbi:MAG: hypothetical protein JW727_06330 [Candidatus Aenigmarchaeota archaeon]|nr:hypothetical protein [Candidatus Aenigmarchaeota archaeon]
MAHLKGMDTWIWLVGGIIVTILSMFLFLNLFASINLQSHTQASVETSGNLASDINRLCSMKEGEAMNREMKFSTIVTEFYASHNGSIEIDSGRTYGQLLCVNISGKSSCSELDCPLEISTIITEKKILSLIDKMRGDISYRDYSVEAVRTSCGVSVLLKGERSGCICGLGEFDTPVYCDYNGHQPIVISKDHSVVLADTEPWLSPDEDSLQLFSNIAGYLGGNSILILYDDDSVDPALTQASQVIDQVISEGYSVDSVLHEAAVDFSAYDQVWLVTPGFCELSSRNCSQHYRWSVNEEKRLIEYADSGGKILLVTDSGLVNGVYGQMGLDLINSLLIELGYPLEQLPSCVCGCEGRPTNQTVLEAGGIGDGLSVLNVLGAAVFRETCIYDPKESGGDSGVGGCGSDRLCYPNCPSGDPDCSCIEQNGFVCDEEKDCPGTKLKHAGGRTCCSEQCSASGPQVCQNTSDVPEGGLCVCTGQCQPGLSCGDKKRCCPAGAEWNGSKCSKSEICSSSISKCYGQGHWEHYGSRNFFSNVGRACECKIYSGMTTPAPQSQRCYGCDYVEVCQSSVVKPIAEEIINCCNSKCTDSGGHGSCMKYCSNAVQNSGLSSTETDDTLKKCYGLYAIYGMGPGAKWTRGYMLHIEAPASVMFSGGTWMCSGYSLMLTTLLRSVGYTTSEAYSISSDDHAYNLVKFPGDTKYTLADTVNNRPSPVRLGSVPGGYLHCSYISNTCGNDAGMFTCPSRGNVYGC